MTTLLNKQAPDFTLLNENSRKVTLSSFRGGPVVLLFYPFAFSSTCTDEMCSVRDNHAIYNSLKAKVLGISIDSHFTLKQWAELNKINFDLLSDFNKEVISAYGCMYEIFVPGIFDYKGVSKRSAFVIDKDGIVRYEEILEDARLIPDFTKILQAVERLS